MYNHLCTACGSERPTCRPCERRSPHSSLGLFSSHNGLSYSDWFASTTPVLAHYSDFSYVPTVSRTPTLALSCVAKRSAITSASPGSTAPLGSTLHTPSTCKLILLRFALRSTPPKLSCACETSPRFRSVRCKSEMILRGTVIPCVDGDLEIICCAVDEGRRFHLAGINLGSTNRSTRNVT